MTLDTGIPEEHWHSIVALLRNEPTITDAKLYGSRAKGNFREGSDIDLALFGENITMRTLTEIELAYDQLYLPWKLDLSIYSTISNTDLRDHIDRVGRSVF